MDRLKKPFFILLCMVAVLFPILFYSSSLRHRQDLSFLEKIMGSVTSPFETFFQNLGSRVEKMSENYNDLKEAQKKIREQNEQIMRLSTLYQQYQELQQENNQLRKLLEYKKKTSPDLILSKIVGIDPSFYFKSVKLNRGSKDGVYPGMGVVSLRGVFGVVMRSQKDSCDVLLVTDPNFRVDAMVARNRLRGVLEGTSQHSLRFRYLAEGTPIVEGDKVVTSGMTGIFPPGLLLGFAKKTDKGAKQINVESHVDFHSTHEVLIVRTKSNSSRVLLQEGGLRWFNRLFHTSDKREALE